MATDITGKEKQVYAEGTEVTFNLNGITKGRGKVRGLASEGLIDLWIVQFDPEKSEGIDPTKYPWSCIVVPHTLMQKA